MITGKLKVCQLLSTFSATQNLPSFIPVVFITSNFVGNFEIQHGCKELGIPAFGTLWDFVSLVDHSIRDSLLTPS